MRRFFDHDRIQTRQHFERLYSANPDPWGFQTSAYEQAKYRRTVEALGDRRFASVLEVGCSIGILTRMLAPRCDAIPGGGHRRGAAGGGAGAVRRSAMGAVRADAGAGGVAGRAVRPDRVVRGAVFSLGGRHRAVCPPGRWNAAAGRGVVLVNWLGQTDDPSSGDARPERLFRRRRRLRVVAQERHEGYRLEVLDHRVNGLDERAASTDISSSPGAGAASAAKAQQVR